jgi:diazepam-binding inhibitor (GABA receptor modulator, acyl-CoA-binding protein)
MQAQDLNAQLAQAQASINALEERPDNGHMLKLYALYKQATQGVNTKPAPGGFDFVGQAKHGAWAALGEMPQDEAKRAYIDLAKVVTA